ncbi:hypothetical protein D3C76_1109170 [compost metagenome]
MQLEGLTSSKTDGSTAIAVGNTIHHQPLVRSHDPSRSTYTEHELIGRLKLLLLAFVAQIPIVLHIAAVELHQSIFVLRNRSGNSIFQHFFKLAA